MRRKYWVRKDDEFHTVFRDYLLKNVREILNKYYNIENNLKLQGKTHKDFGEWYSNIKLQIDELKDIVNILDSIHTKLNQKIEDIVETKEETVKYRNLFHIVSDYINYAYPDHSIKILEDYLKDNPGVYIAYLNIEEAYVIEELVLKDIGEILKRLSLLHSRLYDFF